MKKTIYFNVLTGSLSGMLAKPDSDYILGEFPNFSKSPRWYNPSSNPHFCDPYILISAPHNRNKKDIRSEMNISDKTTVFIDSGGFQLATGVVNESQWNKKIALEWSENNGDVFPILDMPVSSQGRSFDEVLKFSQESAKYYVENRSKTGCHILNVLSANSLSNMENWYNGMKEYKLDGWAYGGHKNFVKPIIQSIIFLHSKGEFDSGELKYLHMFGTTSFASMPYIIYAQHLLNKMGINCQLTFDSSSASSLANFGKYILSCTPSGVASVKVSNAVLKDKSLAHAKLGCPCPYCQDITDIKYLFSDEGKWQYYAIFAMHNYYHMMQFKKMLEGLISLDSKDVIESFPTFMKKNFLALDKAFSKMGDGGLGVIENELNQDSNAKPIVIGGSNKSLKKFF